MKKTTLCLAAFSAGTILAGGGVASAKELEKPSDERSTRLHKVEGGETLSAISQSELGSSNRWVELLALNGRAIDHPDRIEVGQVIAIPSTENRTVDVVRATAKLATKKNAAKQVGPTKLESSQEESSRVESSEVEAEQVEPEKEKREKDEPAEVTKSAPTKSAPTKSAPARATLPVVRWSGGSSIMAAIRSCESGGNYGALSPDGLYRGAYQFDRSTWSSVGGLGDPAAAPPAEQDARALRLRSLRGSSPWPNCG